MKEIFNSNNRKFYIRDYMDLGNSAPAEYEFIEEINSELYAQVKFYHTRNEIKELRDRLNQLLSEK